jgi:hypothetical protein
MTIARLLGVVALSASVLVLIGAPAKAMLAGLAIGAVLVRATNRFTTTRSPR